MSSPKIILIAGPTASGKSALALEKAKSLNGVIINADAMQVYSGLPILTNQPSAAAQKAIPHELYAVLDPSERSSAGKWRALAQDAIEKALQAGRTPILIGGTGLYFRALLGGLADIPEIPEAVRTQTKNLYDELGEEKFRRELAKLDPESASRIARNDRQRLIRAYEVVVHTGRPLGEWQKKGLGARGWGSKENGSLFLAPSPQPLAPESHLLMLERDQLYAACNARFAEMIKRGAVEEARAFLKRGLDPALPAMKTIGLREIAAHLRGDISLDAAIAKAQQATRNYAKRQLTWFRNQPLLGPIE
jgi:tRNA dimethylallyltransferase